MQAPELAVQEMKRAVGNTKIYIKRVDYSKD
jgi:hypothetical protein